MNNNKYSIIAETAFSHEGEVEYLYKQIDEAYKGKADYVKFQVFLNPEESYVSNEVQKKVKKWIISPEDWAKVFKYSKKLNLKIIALPLNKSTAKYCLKHEEMIDAYEIHSVCFNDINLLDVLSQTEKDIILGIGGRLPHEIDTVINKFKNNNIILMFGFQSFPTDYTLLGLSRIKYLKKIFNCEIGFADHTTYNDKYFHNINDYAFLNGALYFEKHIVLEKGKSRIDYESGIDSEDFLEMRERLNLLKQIQGDGNIFSLSEKELKYKQREKQLVFSNDIEKNHMLSEMDLSFKISDDISDFNQIDYNNLIGKRLLSNVKKNESVKFRHIKGN